MRRFVQAFASAQSLPATFPDGLSEALCALPDRYNISVRKHAGVVHGDADRIAVGDFRWGLVPRWSKEPDTKYTTVTARLDRASASRIYREAWHCRRCVIPMNGYYKWDRTVSPPIPYFIQARSGATLLAAGLWETWSKGEPAFNSFSILTHPNAAIPAPLVPDGPVFLPHDRWQKWVAGEPWLPLLFLKGLPQPALEAYPVSRAVRHPDRDDYTLLEPVDPAELSPDTDDPDAFADEAEDDVDE
jgi:putative SOS response-associated peptidase YedK